ncbi:MAG: hypothetical protein IJF40_07920 [Clostridia bacterium]|nr:hypothetical protein [Clostridia bacterium]
MKILGRVLTAIFSFAVFPWAFFVGAFRYYVVTPEEVYFPDNLSIKQLIELLVNNPNSADELSQTFKLIMPYAIAFAVLFVLTLLSAATIFVMSIVSYKRKAIQCIAWIGIALFFVANLVFFGLSDVILENSIDLGMVLGNTFGDTTGGAEYHVFMTDGIRFISKFLLVTTFANIEPKKKKAEAEEEKT